MLFLYPLPPRLSFLRVKLLFINQYYWPDNAATAQMLSDLCEYLASFGHDVHVLCSGGAYSRGSNTATAMSAYEHEKGVHIHRTPATSFGNRHLLLQLTDFASFHAHTALHALMNGSRYDAIITLTTPPLVGLHATPVRVLGSTAHIAWCMDLHPDAEFALGMLDPKRPVSRLFNYLDTLHLRKADICVSLGRRMTQRLIARGVDPSRIAMIPVWGHGHVDGTIEQDNPMRHELGLAGKFVVMYSGNAGLIHTFDDICQAALALRDDPRFVFIFSGAGRRVAEIDAFRRQHNLQNMRMMGYLPREKLKHYLALADVHLVCLREEMAGISVPCKLYGVMAAGRPALFIGPTDGESAAAIRDHDCGRALPTGQPALLISALNDLAANPALRHRLGQNARQAFEHEYSAAVCCEQWRSSSRQCRSQKPIA